MTTIVLSRPPLSLYQLYGRNRTGRQYKTRMYVNWLKQSQAEILLQKSPKHTECVDILIRIPRAGVRASSDASNRIKAAEDLLVSMQVIPDDRMKYVNSSKAEFADDIDRTEIIITAVEREAV